jgi:hypothetical protein
VTVVPDTCQIGFPSWAVPGTVTGRRDHVGRAVSEVVVTEFDANALDGQQERMVLHGSAKFTLMQWMAHWLTDLDLSMQRGASPSIRQHSEVDAFHFVIALAGLERAGRAVLGEDHRSMQIFHAMVPDARAIRDVVSHFDEYVVGTGRLQKSGRVGHPLAVGFIRHGENLLILVGGLELPVKTAHVAARQLVQAADAHYDAEKREAGERRT